MAGKQGSRADAGSPDWRGCWRRGEENGFERDGEVDPATYFTQSHMCGVQKYTYIAGWRYRYTYLYSKNGI